MISVAIEAIKSLIILNGGAIVALLAYLGQINNPVQALYAKCPFIFFIIGLFLSCLSFFSVYLTQYTLYNEEKTEKDFKHKHMNWFWFTFAFTLASIIFFALGAFASLSVFSAS